VTFSTPRQVLLVQAIVLGGAVALWIAATERQWVSPIMLAGPVAIARDRGGPGPGRAAARPRGHRDRVAVAVGLGRTAGLAVGLAGGVAATDSGALYPVLIALSSIPVFILYPLFVVWFGMGRRRKYAFGAVYAFFPIALNAFAAVRCRPPAPREGGARPRGPCRST
jgi:ABC-type nitrate/sulfonate/bicarbonate transport system permease component